MKVAFRPGDRGAREEILAEGRETPRVRRIEARSTVDELVHRPRDVQ